MVNHPKKSLVSTIAFCNDIKANLNLRESLFRLTQADKAPHTKVLLIDEAHGLLIFGFFTDVASGAQKDRPNLDSILEFLEGNQDKGDYGFICTKLNRLSRFSVNDTMDLVFKLRRLTNDNIIFVDEPMLDFKNEEIVAQTYLALKSLLSVEWRDEHSKNVKRGIARVRAEGQSWGRKRKEVNLKQYRRLKEVGASLSMIAKIFGMSRPTLGCPARL